jgi:hypothetical protein
MPIRFRCVYCNQLLGISRRKAGTIVRCTTCEGQLIVPDPSDAATEGAGSDVPVPQPEPDDARKTEAAVSQPVVAAAGGVFEDSEFDAFLEPLNGGGAGPAIVSPPAPSKRSVPSLAAVTPRPSVAAAIQGLPRDAAVTLSHRGLTIAVVLAVLGLGLSFAGGLWLGLAMR